MYDSIVNPGHWTEDMREDALEPAKLDSPDLKVGERECVCVLCVCVRACVCVCVPVCVCVSLCF